jgi:hypothetical protein
MAQPVALAIVMALANHLNLAEDLAIALARFQIDIAVTNALGIAQLKL